jgi:hypothetical protein
MPNSYSYSWQQPYLEALNETDEKRLLELVYAAEEAIFRRSLELSGSEDHCEERREIKAACKGLLSIEVNKLGWPSPLLDEESSSAD